MNLPHITKALALGGAVLALSAGASLAAVATSSVNVRSGPSTGYQIVDTLQRGEQVNIVDRSGSWCAVDKAGPNGWVSCAFLADVSYRSSGDRYYRASPSISLSFGIGTNRPSRPHRDRDDDHGHWSGPGSYYGNSGGSFGLSFMN